MQGLVASCCIADGPLRQHPRHRSVERDPGKCVQFALGHVTPGHFLHKPFSYPLLKLLRLPFPCGIRGFLKGFLLPDYPFLLFRHGFVILLALCRRQRSLQPFDLFIRYLPTCGYNSL